MTPIPKTLFTYYHSKEKMSPRMKRHWETWIHRHPDFTCLLFDEQDAVSFLSAHFDAEIGRLFALFKPQSFKSDVFRLCYMYLHGGIYMDIKYEAINGFTFHRLLDKDRMVSERLGIQNCLFVSRPRNPVFLYALNLMKENGRRRTYGLGRDSFIDCLSLTGPVLLSHIYFTYFLHKKKYEEEFSDAGPLDKPILLEAIDDAYPVEKTSHEELLWQDPLCHKIYWKDELILQQYDTYRDDLLFENKETRHYSAMFEDRDIYEEPK
jgi:hypothetical protein